MHLIKTKLTNYDTRDFSMDARIPQMFYQAQPDDFQNTRIYIPPEMYSPYNSGTSNVKKMGIVIPVSCCLLTSINHLKRIHMYRSKSN